jgi:molecular chaperone HscC
MRVQDGAAEYSMTLDEAALESWCAPLLARLRDPVERALRDARLSIAELDSIVLAGGATRMPVVRRMVTRMFGRFPACEINPDEVVALGAAVQAGLKSRDAALDEVVMTDVAPYSLGLEVGKYLVNGAVSSGYYDPVIERNVVVPVSRVKRYWPMSAGQRVLEILVYQGEARMVKDNVKLGELRIDIDPGPIEGNGVDVRFTYDANGLLQVEATLERSGETRALVIQGNPGLLSEAEIAARFAALAELKIHPRERIENRTLLARGERLYQQLRGDMREYLGQNVMQFEQALDTQDAHVIAPAAREFRALLDEVEQHSPLTTG